MVCSLTVPRSHRRFMRSAGRAPDITGCHKKRHLRDRTLARGRIQSATRVRGLRRGSFLAKMPPFEKHEPHSHELPPDEVIRRRVKAELRDRKSTRLNSSHVAISYAVFCL